MAMAVPITPPPTIKTRPFTAKHLASRATVAYRSLASAPMIPPRRTRTIHVRDLPIGGAAPIAVQSMAATRTRDVEATIRQVRLLEEAGADLVRIAVDSKADVEALAEVRARTSARLSVDLQENYRLAALVAPHVDKIRYNPGHLHHHEREKPDAEKVDFLVGVAQEHGLALRIGVNAGSIAPAYQERFPGVRSSVRRMCAQCKIVKRRGVVRVICKADPRHKQRQGK